MSINDERSAKIAPETLAAQALGRVSEPYRDIVPPLHPTTTFERAEDGSYPGGRVYSRDASPAYDQPPPPRFCIHSNPAIASSPP